jgi:hypothetical protein
VRLAVVALLAGLAAAGCGSTAHAAAWTGTYRLPADADPVGISVQLSGTTATVALGPGHLGRTTLPLRASEARACASPCPVGSSSPGRSTGAR